MRTSTGFRLLTVFALIAPGLVVLWWPRSHHQLSFASPVVVTAMSGKDRSEGFINVGATVCKEELRYPTEGSSWVSFRVNIDGLVGMSTKGEGFRPVYGRVRR